MNKYVATVRVMGQSIKTLVFADSAIHARLLTQFQFGMNSVIANPTLAQSNTNGYIPLDEVIKAKKSLTQQQARIPSLQTQKANVTKQLKAERDRQKIQQAQQIIQSVVTNR